MASTTQDPPWWDVPAVRAAIESARWDTVLATAIEATGATQQTLASATGLSQSQISRIIAGTRKPRQIATLTALADGLGIPRQMAGLADAPEDDTNRREFMAAASATAIAGVAATMVPADLLSDLAAPTRTYRRAEATTAASMLRPPAAAHLNLLRHMAADAERDGRASDSRRLHALVAEAAGFTAWLSIDGDDRATARRQYLLSVASAHKTRQPLLVVYMTASLAQFAAGVGDVRNATQLLCRARQTLPASAPPIASVWLDCVEASIIAARGDENALRLLDSASRTLTSADPVWPWLMRFDAAKLAAYRETVSVRMRRSPQSWSKAKHPLTAPHPKIAAERLSERAAALIDLGAPEEACGLAHTVLDVAQRMRSDRLTRAVLDLRDRFDPTLNGGDLDRLDSRLATIYDQE